MEKVYTIDNQERQCVQYLGDIIEDMKDNDLTEIGIIEAIHDDNLTDGWCNDWDSYLYWGIEGCSSDECKCLQVKDGKRSCKYYEKNEYKDGKSYILNVNGEMKESK